MKAPLSERQGQKKFKKFQKNLLTNFQAYAILNLQRTKKAERHNKERGVYYDKERDVQGNPQRSYR